jgi:hypothetical protein
MKEIIQYIKQNLNKKDAKNNKTAVNMMKILKILCKHNLQIICDDNQSSRIFAVATIAASDVKVWCWGLGGVVIIYGV